MIESFINVDGLHTRFFEEGSGPSILLVHGGTLGFSGAMWQRNMEPIARHGFRVVAYDQPGFGQSSPPPEFGIGFREQFMAHVVDKLNMGCPILVGHSQGGQLVVGAAISSPKAYAGVMVLGTGSLLPPLAAEKKGADSVLSEADPTPEDVRRLLMSNLHDHSVITPEVLSEFYKNCVGENFEYAKSRAKSSGGGSAVPLWRRLDEIKTGSKFLYGRQDRGDPAARIQLARERYPSLDIELVEDCHHILQWDQPLLIEERIIAFARAAHGDKPS
jgi:4,5:9,10-diseco-3-hydroxy-5,9,17-trioxoandrosta-1(10),2-diene-4-oate hydrolase